MRDLLTQKELYRSFSLGSKCYMIFFFFFYFEQHTHTHTQRLSQRLLQDTITRRAFYIGLNTRSSISASANKISSRIEKEFRALFNFLQNAR